MLEQNIKTHGNKISLKTTATIIRNKPTFIRELAFRCDFLHPTEGL